jgi:hypothetical protein
VAIFATAYFPDVSWLWCKVIGCAVVIAVAPGITLGTPVLLGRTFAY